jgi:hypothetical protein
LRTPAPPRTVNAATHWGVLDKADSPVLIAEPLMNPSPRFARRLLVTLGLPLCLTLGAVSVPSPAHAWGDREQAALAGAVLGGLLAAQTAAPGPGAYYAPPPSYAPPVSYASGLPYAAPPLQWIPQASVGYVGYGGQPVYRAPAYPSAPVVIYRGAPTFVAPVHAWGYAHRHAHGGWR